MQVLRRIWRAPEIEDVANSGKVEAPSGLSEGPPNCEQEVGIYIYGWKLLVRSNWLEVTRSVAPPYLSSAEQKASFVVAE